MANLIMRAEPAAFEAGVGQMREPVARTLSAGLPDAERRPTTVLGPLGTMLTLETLPPADTSRWVVRRKAEVLAAINGGLLSEAEACARYQLSPEELELWQQAVDRAGVPGLRVTRIQLYRDYEMPLSKRASYGLLPQAAL